MSTSTITPAAAPPTTNSRRRGIARGTREVSGCIAIRVLPVASAGAGPSLAGSAAAPCAGELADDDGGGSIPSDRSRSIGSAATLGASGALTGVASVRSVGVAVDTGGSMSTAAVIGSGGRSGAGAGRPITVERSGASGGLPIDVPGLGRSVLAAGRDGEGTFGSAPRIELASFFADGSPVAIFCDGSRVTIFWDGSRSATFGGGSGVTIF